MLTNKKYLFLIGEIAFFGKRFNLDDIEKCFLNKNFNIAKQKITSFKDHKNV